jgi:hypothetical protein
MAKAQKITSQKLLKFIDKIEKNHKLLAKASQDFARNKIEFDKLLDEEYGVGQVDTVDLPSRRIFFFKDLVKDLETHITGGRQPEVTEVEDVEVIEVDNTPAEQKPTEH